MFAKPASSFAIASLVALMGAPILSATDPAQAADPPRYTMTPANGGFIRMDTQSGVLSFCSTRSGALTCEIVPDDRIAITREAEELKKKNTELAEENRRLEEMLLGDGATNQTSGKKAFKLPTEQEVDQALSYVERIYKKFRDKIRQLQEQNNNGNGTQL